MVAKLMLNIVYSINSVNIMSCRYLESGYLRHCIIKDFAYETLQ